MFPDKGEYCKGVSSAFICPGASGKQLRQVKDPDFLWIPRRCFGGCPKGFGHQWGNLKALGRCK